MSVSAPSASDRGAARAAADRKSRQAREKAKTARLIDDVLPPEGVPLKFEVADLGARLGAQLVDIGLSVLALVAIVTLVAFLFEPAYATMTALGSLLFFFIRTPYYVLTELLWNGQTLGKRLIGMRVLSGTGSGLTPYQVVARNMTKELEVFAPGTYLLIIGPDNWIESLIVALWIVGLILVPAFNRRRQRVGDLIANTYVVYQPRALLMPDLSTEARAEVAAERFRFQTRHLEHYGAYELQVLEQILQAVPGQAAGPDALARWRENLTAIADRVRAKTEYEDRVAPGDEEAFLRAFYTAQRAFLESRRLFGDDRADKHFKSDRAGSEPEDAPRGGSNA